MPRLLVIDDRDQTVEMVHRQLPAVRHRHPLRPAHPLPGVRGARRAAARCAARTTTARRRRRSGALPALPDLVVLDLHFALPEERLLPEDKSRCPTSPKARQARRSRSCGAGRAC